MSGAAPRPGRRSLWLSLKRFVRRTRPFERRWIADDAERDRHYSIVRGRVRVSTLPRPAEEAAATGPETPSAPPPADRPPARRRRKRAPATKAG